MNKDASLTNILLLLKDIMSPQPIGKMDVDYPLRLSHLNTVKEYIQTHNAELSKFRGETYFEMAHFFFLIYEIIDYFGINITNKEIQLKTYSLGMEFLNIFGILYKNYVLNPQGTEIFYKQMTLLDNQFLLYQDLLPDLFSKVEAICWMKTTNSEVMKINMSTCMFHSALTRVIVNHEKQIMKEKEQDHIIKAMEHVLKCNFDYLSISPTANIDEGYKNTLWDLIYRIELSPFLFYSLHEFVNAIVPYISPGNREKQLGRMSIRVALISAEMDFRQVLMALRCFQFKMVVQICETTLIRLDINGYFAAEHAGIGPMCFNGFIIKFLEIAQSVLLIFEEMSIWSYTGAHCAGELIGKVLITVCNLPVKRGWEGPWSKINDRAINLINTMAGLKESDTFSKLFNQ